MAAKVTETILWDNRPAMHLMDKSREMRREQDATLVHHNLRGKFRKRSHVPMRYQPQTEVAPILLEPQTPLPVPQAPIPELASF